MTENELEIIFGIESKLSGNKIFVKEEDFEIPHGEDYKLAIEFLKTLTKQRFDGKTVLEHLYLDEVSYWWFIYQSLIPELKKQLNFIQNFSAYVKNKNPNKVTIENNFEYLEIIKQICNNYGIKLSYSKFRSIKFVSKNKSKDSIQKIRYRNIHQEKINIRKSLFEEKHRQIPDFSNKIIFATSSNFRRIIFDFQNGNFKRGEFMISNLFEYFDDSELIGFDLDYTFKGTPAILAERLDEIFPWIPLEILLKNYEKIDSKLIPIYKKLISNNDFQHTFSFLGINFWNEIKFFFEKMCFEPYLPFYSLLVYAIIEHFSISKPKALFIPYETGSIALALISACKKLKIPTIGIQHGYIYPYNPMYSYGEICSDSNIYGFPIPNYLLLYGNYTKDLLISNGYPEKRLIVFGNASFFNLDNFKLKFNFEESAKKFSICEHERVILFTTGKLQRAYSSAGKYDYDEKIVEYLIRKFNNNKNYKIIIKPHPTETDVKIYEKLIEKNFSNNIFISQENLFELISLSSVIVSVFSTTMYDALCFEKPVLRVKFSENEFHEIDNSKSIIVTDLETLGENIINLEKIFTHEMYSINSKKFIKEQFGLPEKNPKDVIKKLINY